MGGGGDVVSVDDDDEEEDDDDDDSVDEEAMVLLVVSVFHESVCVCVCVCVCVSFSNMEERRNEWNNTHTQQARENQKTKLTRESVVYMGADGWNHNQNNQPNVSPPILGDQPCTHRYMHVTS